MNSSGGQISGEILTSSLHAANSSNWLSYWIFYLTDSQEISRMLLDGGLRMLSIEIFGYLQFVVESVWYSWAHAAQNGHAWQARQYMRV